MAIVTTPTAQSTPQTSSWSSMKSDVASYVMADNNDRALAKADDFLRCAVDEINMRVWGWNLVYQDFTFVANQRDYTIPSQFKAARDCQTIDASGNTISRLDYRDPSEFNRIAPNNSLAVQPRLYTVRNATEYSTLSLDALPTTGLISITPTFRVWYFRRTQYGDPVDFPPEVSAFLRWRAKTDMAAHFDPQKVGFAKAKADALWNRLVADDRESQYQSIPLAYYP